MSVRSYHWYGIASAECPWGGLFTHLSTCGMTMIFSKTCAEKYSPLFLAGSSKVALLPFYERCQESDLILLLQFKPAASWFSIVGNREWAYPSCHTIAFHILEGFYAVFYSAVPFPQFLFFLMNYIWTNDFCGLPVDSKIYLHFQVCCLKLDIGTLLRLPSAKHSRQFLSCILNQNIQLFGVALLL